MLRTCNSLNSTIEVNAAAPRSLADVFVAAVITLLFSCSFSVNGSIPVIDRSVVQFCSVVSRDPLRRRRRSHRLPLPELRSRRRHQRRQCRHPPFRSRRCSTWPSSAWIRQPLPQWRVLNQLRKRQSPAWKNHRIPHVTVELGN